jgi:hypothetical protein
MLLRKGYDSDVAVEALRAVTTPSAQEQPRGTGTALAPDP